MSVGSETLVNELLSMKERIDDLYRETVHAVQSDPDAENALAEWNPAADVFENEEEWKAVVDLPGVSKADLSVELVQNILILSGTRSNGASRSHEAVLCERPWGPFRRQWTLPENIVPEKVVADYRHGVLTIVVPKNAVASRKVPVRAET
ncbi:Hsp20/alpha crystallin family protein [Desulfosoma caldarium]|uniref:HSP20 family protein n=1 Tax=Desulfosoma caldarium TaxID=610254 RepID=A0A3N1VR15_9BACT|nr:Hsp20/alpha crystallin family protein [Desulfosoma caldarium]ROR03508.1 HSP20 family protein [Desulfosoma caldarium]